MQAGKQNDEFVASQSRHGVDVAQLLFQSNGNAFEQQVADRMTKAVIDVFEAIQIEEKHGALTAVFLLIVECGEQSAFEQCAVGQPGQRIVVRLVVELGLGMLEAGDVRKHGDKVSNEFVPVAHRADR